MFQAAPLGGSEVAMWQLGRVASANLAFVGRVEGPLDAEVFLRAVRSVRARHPRLAARVARRGRQLLFVPADEPMDVRLSPRVTDDDWQAVVRRELDEAIDPTREPLARVRCLHDQRGFDVVWVLHHSVADGISGTLLIRDLLTSMAADDHPAEALPCGGVLPLEARIARPGLTGLLELARGLLAQLFWLVFLRVRQLPALAAAEPADRRQGLLHRVLERDDLERVRALCRDQGVRITAALGAAMMQAVAVERSHKSRVPLSCFVPMNLREHMGGRRDEVGLFVSFKTALARCDGKPASFWEIARVVQRQLTRATERREALATVWLQSKVVDSRLSEQQVRRRTEPFTCTSVGVTNVGVAEIPREYGGHRLMAMTTAGASHASGSCVSTSAITFDGRLFLTFFYAQPLVSDAAAARIADRAIARLLAACGASERADFDDSHDGPALDRLGSQASMGARP
jgi:NRPS condensation-like uncharacterized protein